VVGLNNNKKDSEDMPFTTPNAGLPSSSSSNGLNGDGPHHAEQSSLVDDRASAPVQAPSAPAPSTSNGHANGNGSTVDQYDHSRVEHYIGQFDSALPV
jgi:hypothetical protein